MLQIEVEPEVDGRWIAEVVALPGTLAYGATATQARARATSTTYLPFTMAWSLGASRLGRAGLRAYLYRDEVVPYK